MDNRSGRLKTGLFAQGNVITGVNAQAVVIPAAAAYRDDRSVKDSYVFVVEQGVPEALERVHESKSETEKALASGADVLVVDDGSRDGSDKVYVVLSGRVKVYSSNDAGREFVIDFQLPL